MRGKTVGKGKENVIIYSKFYLSNVMHYLQFKLSLINGNQNIYTLLWSLTLLIVSILVVSTQIVSILTLFYTNCFYSREN